MSVPAIFTVSPALPKLMVVALLPVSTFTTCDVGTGIGGNTYTVTYTVTDTGSTHPTSFASRNEITKIIVLIISCVIAVII